MGDPACALRLVGVRRSFGTGAERTVALDGVDLDITAGSFVAIMGATGSGKSTLLNCSAGLERCESGSVQVLDRTLTDMDEASLSRFRRRHVGFVFQSYNLLSELTVRQNVLLPCRLGGPRGRALDEVLDSVGLASHADRQVGELSGGQRQRVAVARALITRPGVIFADEPTGALDPTTGSQILQLLRNAVDQEGHTVVMVTHDPHAAVVADRLILLSDGAIVDDRPAPDAATITDLLARASKAAA